MLDALYHTFRKWVEIVRGLYFQFHIFCQEPCTRPMSCTLCGTYAVLLSPPLSPSLSLPLSPPLTTICTREDSTRVCCKCLASLRVPVHELRNGKMRCLLHLVTSCCPFVPVHTYLSWLQRCLPPEEVATIATAIAHRNHAAAAREDPDLQLMQCSGCNAYASLYSHRLRSWSTVQCGLCLLAVCQRCRGTVASMPARTEPAQNMQTDAVPWRVSDYKGNKGCACPPVQAWDVRAQVLRSVKKLGGSVDPAIEECMKQVVRKTEASNATETKSVTLAELVDTAAALLALPASLRVAEDTSGGVPSAPQNGLDVLNWMMDDVEALPAADRAHAQDLSAAAWFATVPSATALYCMRLAQYWHPALRRLLPVFSPCTSVHSPFTLPCSPKACP